MFINKTADGRNNRCGGAVARLRVAMGISQRQLADLLQLQGLEMDKNAVQRIEAGKRFVTDIEIVHLACVLNTNIPTLLEAPDGLH